MNPNRMQELSTISTAVHLVDRDDPVTAHVTNPSMVAWDIHRADKRWPKQDEAPFLWLTFVCWDALCRQGEYPRTHVDGKTETPSFPRFRDQDCLAIDEPDDDNVSPADPTTPAAEAGSPLHSASEQASTGNVSTTQPTPS